MGCEGTITSNEIKLYIRQLAISRSSDQSFKNIGFIMMYDNSKVHSCEAICQFLWKSQLRAIGIAAYSPMLNPCKKLIGVTKSIVRKFQSEGR